MPSVATRSAVKRAGPEKRTRATMPRVTKPAPSAAPTPAEHEASRAEVLPDPPAAAEPREPRER